MSSITPAVHVSQTTAPSVALVPPSNQGQCIDAGGGDVELQKYNECNARLDVVVEKWYLRFCVRSKRLSRELAGKLLVSTVAECEREMAAIVAEYHELEIPYIVTGIVMINPLQDGH
jgi:hypothetical protein